MTAASPLHQFQHGASSLAVRCPSSLPDCHAPYLLGHRDPIASRAFSFVSRKLACQGQFPRVYSKLLQYICQDRPEGLHRHFRFLQMRSTDGSTTIGKAFADGQKVTVGASKSD